MELVQVIASDVIVNVQVVVILDVVEHVLVTALGVIHNVLVDVILNVQVTVKTIALGADPVLGSVVLCVQLHAAENV